eukprot:scaffold42688_cov61-Phaeocystis_antarctica.AAC.8
MRLCLLLAIMIIVRLRLLDGHPPLLRRPGRGLPGCGRRRHLAGPRRGRLVGRRAAPRQLGEQLVEPALLHRLEAGARCHLRAQGGAEVRRAHRAHRAHRAQRRQWAQREQTSRFRSAQVSSSRTLLAPECSTMSAACSARCHSPRSERSSRLAHALQGRGPGRLFCRGASGGATAAVAVVAAVAAVAAVAVGAVGAGVGAGAGEGAGRRCGAAAA